VSQTYNVSLVMTSVHNFSEVQNQGAFMSGQPSPLINHGFYSRQKQQTLNVPSPQHPDLLWQTASALPNRYQWTFLWEAGHLPPRIAKDKRARSYKFSPPHLICLSGSLSYSRTLISKVTLPMPIPFIALLKIFKMFQTFKIRHTQIIM
jgi:hypothetical protein